jgi:hypothetical protein
VRHAAAEFPIRRIDPARCQVDAPDCLLRMLGGGHMYALIRQYEGLDTNMRETATRKAHLELRPLLAKSPEFVSYELIQPEGKTDAVTSISGFKTRADARHPTRSPGIGFTRTCPP